MVLRKLNKAILAIILLEASINDLYFFRKCATQASAVSQGSFGTRTVPNFAWVRQQAKSIKDHSVLFDEAQQINERDHVQASLQGIETRDNLWSDEHFAGCTKLWDLNNEDQAKLRILQERLSDIKHWMNDPYEVVRYFMEYDGDIEITERKFRAMINWRIQYDVDNILDNYSPPPLFNYFPVGVLKGVDKDGDPIHVERTGASDMLGLLDKYGKDEMVKHAIWVREQDSHGEWQRKYQRQRGQRVRKFTVIADMHGFNMRHLSPRLTPVGKEVTRFVQDNYPGLAKKIIIIRAPMVFRAAWSMFKPFIDPKMREIVEFSNAKNYEEVLERYMDPDVLPPIIHSKGKGKAADCFHPIWEGGLVSQIKELSPNEELIPEVDITYHQAKEDIQVAPMNVMVRSY